MQIDEMAGSGEPELHHRDQAVAAGERTRLLAERGEKLYCIAHAFRPVIAEWTRNHGRLPSFFARGTLGGTLSPDAARRNYAGTEMRNSHKMRTHAHQVRQRGGPIRALVPSS